LSLRRWTRERREDRRSREDCKFGFLAVGRFLIDYS
jgi:hypothetical protein